MKDREFKEIYSDMLKRIVIYIAVILIVSLTIGLVVSVFDFQWLYDDNPNLYNNLSGVYQLVTSPYILGIVAIIIILVSSYKSIKEVSTYIDTISESVDKIFDKNSEEIILPNQLAPLERKLNHLKNKYVESEKLARENEQKKDELIVYLAHDIKTPLTSMIGYLSLLDEIDDMDKMRRKKYISIALDKSYRLEELINELFDIARFNSEKIVLEKEKLNLNLMLEQIIDDFYPILKELDKKIKYNQVDDLIIEGDSDKLSRVFNNLIKNAINYSSDGTDIIIKALKNNNSVIIEVINQGKVIPKDKLARIFEKFYRLDSARSSKTGGSGLGLAIAKEIVELHNGQIKASSNKKETKFTVILPIE